MLQIVKKNFAKLSNYPRLRIFLIIVAIILVFVIIMNLLSPSTTKNTAPPSQVQAVDTSGGSKSQRPAPQNQTATYQTLASADQAAAEKKAIASGGSVFQNAFQPGENSSSPSQQPAANPTPTANSASPGNEVSPEQFASKNPPSGALSQQISDLQQQLNAAQQSSQDQQQQQQQQNMDAQMQSIQSAMRAGLQNVSDSWKLPTLATVQGTAPSSGSSRGGTGQGPVAIKAGSILFGVVDTALDSDSPGTPVLATIVTGPYKGAKLLGAFSATKNALVVQFNIMTMPTMSSSISINAYAIDAKTANNAIATNVDNHYLLRYGMLFASAFLQGFGTAYQNYTYCPPGSQNCSVINTNGSSNLPSNNVTAQTAAYQGLGQVGTTLGQVAANEFNTPPTITVDQGTGIGVLFMSDVRIPVNQ